MTETEVDRHGGHRPSVVGPPGRLAVPVANHVVDREGLYARLTAGLAHPVTVVAAAAGWGKTLLAASWIASGAGGRDAAWVRLEAVGDGADAFWRALAEALATVAGPQARTRLRSLTAGATGEEDLPGLFAEAARLLDRPTVLVLDDLQEVSAPEVHEGLLRLVERPPPALSLLVLTRRDPPWPLARLRLAGAVAEVAGQDLAFDAGEAADLFARLGLDLDADQVRVLVERTEGWPAGLRLVALQLQGRTDGADVDAAVAAFSGDHHSVAGYLVGEVLAGQPPELVRFLETISIVDLVCAELADALTGRDDSEQLLAEFAASHLFVQAVERSGRWYHLHRLIGDLLRSRPLPRRQRRDLHRRAAEWFARHDAPLDAIRAAVAGGLWPMAADLVGCHAVGCVLGGQARELENLLAAVPRAVFAVHAELGCGLAGARIAQGDETEVAELVAIGRAALSGIPEARAARARLLLDLVEGALARARGRWDAVVTLFDAVPVDPVALARLGVSTPELVPMLVDNTLGTAALLRDDLSTAVGHLRAAVAVEQPTTILSQLNAAAYLSLLRCERGELGPAEQAALNVVTWAAGAGLQHTVQAAAAHLAMARIALDRDDLREADDWLGNVAEVEARAVEPHMRVLAALILAARREADGEHERALSGMRVTGNQVDIESLPRTLHERWLVAQATLLARLGDAARARTVLDDLGPLTPGAAALGAVRTLALTGDLAAAAAVRRTAVVEDHPRSRVDAHLVDAVLALGAGDEEAALGRLDDALVVAAPWSLRRPFLHEVVDLRPLLERRLAWGTAAPSFAVDLLERAGGRRADPGRAAVDPLTGRERTVLRYLASTLTNAEIAAELYVSVNTVKTHERSLYRKLGVAGRRDAVARARTLDLL
ncbi:LuxR C-terminal-related transcriptional regulator [Pseudonocardia sp.]|uniref:LuxR C-terminal-related transcriptional regulator n=1 Tax=Pseudonocardia sp. TaxID=60912 RepID=UPI003D12DC92